MLPPHLDDSAARAEWLYRTEIVRSGLARYCRGVDRLDRTLLESVFFEDAVVDHGVFRYSGTDYVDFIMRRGNRGGISHHRVHNVVIELDGGRVWSESYFQASSRAPDGRGGYADLTVTGRYVDVWEARAGTIKVTDHRTVWDLVRTDRLDRKWSTAPATGAITWGRSDALDFSYHSVEKFRGVGPAGTEDSSAE